MKYRVRFNKTRGKPGRGTMEHVWRLFEGEKEYILKHVVFNVPSKTEKEENSEDWNVVCYGKLEIDRTTSTGIINPEN